MGQQLFIVVLCFFNINQCSLSPYPIQFSISEKKIVTSIPTKDWDFAFIVPREMNTYIYTDEETYYRDYQRSYYAITCAKGGWDCMRHYEILANGCIPYFVDIDKCNPKTMAFLPKDLILEAMNLPGVPKLKMDHTVSNKANLKLDHAKFDKKKYYEILNKLLEHARTHLTIKNIAQYILDTIDYSGNGTILFLSNETSPDYMRCCTLAGLKELLGERIIDFPKIEHIYKNYTGDIKELYGKGISYTKVIDDIPVDRDNIEERIKNKEFDLIIYGSVHRGLRYHELVKETYEPEKIVYICGEDAHTCEFTHLHHLFLREFDALPQHRSIQ